MAEKRGSPRLDRRLTALAGRQHGVVTRDQLIRMGFSDDAIAVRVRAGWLRRVHRGVFTVGRQPPTMHTHFLAAVVSFGPRAVLSHSSAAVLWGLLPARGPRVDVTVPSGVRGRRAIVVHRSPLTDNEITTRYGIPVTTPVRTILDLAAVVSGRELERAMDEAAYLRLDLSGLKPRRGRRGGAVITRVLAEHRAGTTLTRTNLEERMLALCDRLGLRDRARLIVETDGWQAHGTRKAFEADRRRDSDLMAAGWRPLRVTWRRLTDEPDGVAEQLRQLLA